MTYRIGESIVNIQISASELQKQCAGFKYELDNVVELAKLIKSSASFLIDEWKPKNETSNRRTNRRPDYGKLDMRSTCGTCRHWHHLDGDGQSAFEGECRRRAPELVLDEKGNESPGWPPVNQTHWCGEYLMDTHA